MARVVGVHGIGQRFKGENTLEGEWLPALRDGLRRAETGKLATGEFSCAFYGDVFRGGGKAGGDEPLDAEDLTDDFEIELLAAWHSEAVRLERFDLVAKAPAQRLAEMLSATPLILPVIHLVRRELVPEADPGHLAELFISGLVFLPDTEDPNAPADQICYDFLPGIADTLLNRLQRREAIDVLDVLSRGAEEFLGKDSIDFMAILRGEWGEEVPTSRHAKHFAKVGAKVLRLLGGHFAEAADWIDPPTLPGYEKPPRQLTTDKYGIEFLHLTPGTFAMGSPEGEPGRYDHEGPQHEVELTREFYLGKYPVTQGQYAAVVGENPSHFENAGAEAPVDSVSWEDACAFCRHLNGLDREAGGPPEGWHYALPSEAQWEYACRAGTKSALPTGAIHYRDDEKQLSDDLDPLAWYGGNSDVEYQGGEAPYWRTGAKCGTHPVGGRNPNPWGLYDMLGNVWEWCHDRWQNRYDEGRQTDPVGPAITKSTGRVMRGGGWLDLAGNCRSAIRYSGGPAYRGSDVGFRLALQTGPPEAEYAPEGHGKAEPRDEAELDMARAGSHALLIGWEADEVEGLTAFLKDAQRGGFASITVVPPGGDWKPLWERFCGDGQADENVLVVVYQGKWGGRNPMSGAQLEALAAAPAHVKVFLGEVEGMTTAERERAKKAAGDTLGLAIAERATGLEEMLQLGLGGGWFGLEGNIGISARELIVGIGRTWSREWPGGSRNDALGRFGDPRPRKLSVRVPSRVFEAVVCPNCRHREFHLPGKVQLEMLKVPAGRFRMGRSEAETESFRRETPQHEVTLSRDFYLGKYPVTQAQYRAVTGDSPSEFEQSGRTAPVEQVSWIDALNFCRELNGLSEGDGGPPEGWHYALPSEAQWEYACRAGTQTPFAIGDGENIGSKLANFDGNHPYGEAKKGKYLKQTTPVGDYDPNPWGFYDMHGNVWEWCADGLREYAERAEKDPLGPTGESTVRVVRGGSWFSFARYCRSASRINFGPDYRNGDVGFRLALQTGPPEAAYAPEGHGKAQPRDEAELDMARAGRHALLVGLDDEDDEAKIVGALKRDGFVDAAVIPLADDLDHIAHPKVAELVGEGHPENVLLLAHPGELIYPKRLAAKAGVLLSCEKRLPRGWSGIQVADREALRTILREGLAHGWAGGRGNANITIGEVAEYSRWLGAKTTVARKASEIAIIENNPRHRVIQIGAEGVPLEMLWVRPGTFQMGSQETEPERWEAEGPVHEVQLTRGFWLAKYPVTQRQYQALTGDNPSEFTKAGPDAPVESVSWQQATEFCERLTAEAKTGEGEQFRLPSEAQWEYACRAGTQTPFAIGDGANVGSALANFDGNHPYGKAKKGKYLERTSEVGAYAPNPWGFYDMHGNVWEWCSDRWQDRYDAARQIDPEGPRKGSDRVVRGGSWFDFAGLCRSAARYYNGTDLRFYFVGFRLALQTGRAPEAGPHPDRTAKRSAPGGEG